MRKSLLIALISLVCPVLAMAQNMAYSKTARTSSSVTSEDRLYVTPAVIKAVPATKGIAPSYAVGAWVKIDGLRNVNQLDNVQVIFGYGGREHCNTNGCWNLCLSKEGNLTITGWGGAAADLGVTLPLNEYVHLLVSYNADNTTSTVYMNGEEIASKAWSKAQEWMVNEHPAFYFAGFQYGGEMDDVVFFNKNLSAAEAQLATINPRAIDGLVALYTLDAIAEGTTGRFNSQGGTTSEQLIHETCTAKDASKVWSNGPVYLIDGGGSVAETAPTLVESSRVVAPVEVTVTVADMENGSLVIKNGEEVVASGSTVNSGTELTLEAVPAAGYKLVAITANGEVVEGTTYTVVSDVTFGATFSNESYALTVVNDANLEYTLTQNGVAVTDLAALVGGAEYKLAVNVPNEFTLNSVTLNDEELTATDGVYTFTMSQASTLVISATEKAKYTVTVTPSAKGTITVTADGATVVSGATVVEGTVLTISATAQQGWRLASISANGTTVANNGTYTVTGNVTISATFEEQTIEYCAPTPVSGRTNGNTSTRKERKLTKATITDGTTTVEIAKTGDYANNAFGDASDSNPRPVYDADAIVPQIVTEAGKRITITTTGTGEWMNTYIYLDADANGLDKGDKVFGNYDNTSHLYALTTNVTIPASLKAGTYRLRYMINWDDNQGPCEYGQSSDNGDLIFDVDFVIPAQELANERTVAVASENEAYGTVAILDPATEETSVTTKQADVVVLATPAQGYAFLNWTNAAGEIESTAARYTYEGEADVELTAHFGHSVNYTVTGQGSFSATTAEGATISNGQVLPVGTEVTFTLTPAAGKCVAVFSVNGESKTSAIVDNQYTVTLDQNVAVIVDFADFTAHVSWVVNGNGEVAAGYEFNDEMDGPAIAFGNGDMLSANQFAEGFSIFAYPGAVEGSEGEYETIENVTLQAGDADPEDITEEVLAGNDAGDGEGLREDGSPVYYYAISELPSADLMVVFVFTEGGESAAIDNIFGDDANDDTPTLFYNLEGARVNGNALTPGIYIAKKGKKAAKVYVM